MVLWSPAHSFLGHSLPGGSALTWVIEAAAAAAAVSSVVSDSVWPHRRQPTRLPRPWDSPGKNTGVGCHFLLQCMKVKSEREVAQSCLTLHNPIDCSPPGSSVHGIFQARVLEWVSIAFSDLPVQQYLNSLILEHTSWISILFSSSVTLRHSSAYNTNTSYPWTLWGLEADPQYSQNPHRYQHIHTTIYKIDN